MNPENEGSIDEQKKEMIEQLAKGLEILKMYDDRIPDKDVSAGPWKVRHAWFQNIVFDIGKMKRMQRQGLIEISSPLLFDINEFITHVKSFEFKERNTTEDDILMADKIIDEILEELQKYLD
ncbi:MAG: hypothetical protein PHN19_01020 [Patescibacteria group bacterium]|nr:hypothetical protein [Patescibacteria group bacterium]